jgi:predicted short-subunit dehydrogenase-like oxidoreductase (DUF2520 family)
MPSVTIIGIGRVGRALATALSRAGYRMDALVVRSSNSVPSDIPELGLELFVPAAFLTAIISDIIFICTQDHEIAGVAAAIHGAVKQGSTVFHTSGALSSDVLAPLAAGAAVGSMHPLVSISERTIAEPFHGAYFCVEGDPRAVAIAKSVVADLGGIPFSIDTGKKASYHAAAVMAAGHLVALVDAAFSLMQSCGPDTELSRRLLMPLISSTIANISAQTTSAALTGPFARADTETIDRHLRELENCGDPEILQIYAALGVRSLDLALQQGADGSRIAAIRQRLFMAERDSR